MGHTEKITTLTAQCLNLASEIENKAKAYEDSLHQQDVDILMKDVQPHQWNRPTPNQRAYEVEEDERCAREEAVMMEEFLSPEIRTQLMKGYDEGPEAESADDADFDENQTSSVKTTTPVIIVLARDASYQLKSRIYQLVDDTFLGSFVKLGYQGTGRISDVKAFQDAFKEGHHVIVEFDIGSTFYTRRSFFAAIFALKNGLNPCPRCIVISGSKYDKRGLVSTSGRHHACLFQTLMS